MMKETAVKHVFMIILSKKGIVMQIVSQDTYPIFWVTAQREIRIGHSYIVQTK